MCPPTETVLALQLFGTQEVPLEVYPELHVQAQSAAVFQAEPFHATVTLATLYDEFAGAPACVQETDLELEIHETPPFSV